MSAWIVSKEHIDMLVKAGLNFSPPADRLGWFTEDPTEVGYEQAYATRAKLDSQTADATGSMLWTENVCSVSARYPDDTPDSRPGPISEDIDAEAIEYVYANPHYNPTHGEIFEMIRCYDYQSCEHDGWETSEAKRYCDALRDAVISKLANGPWGWDERTLAEAKAAHPERVDNTVSLFDMIR